MAKKILRLEVTYGYEIEVDEDSSIVKEYKDENELIRDLASYRFTTLPVINNGVEIKDIALFEVNLLP